ncbi:phosphodiester glycosidase family protein [Moheibacter sp. BDHS18]|uniref:Phosphodiester glycosidase family protein n=2 Tax=Moheibacter lacus TaxID=2745851 RepID=A0A838ZFY5_9FLAO|nr:phosphodiester glycosidase family protein [Moheibacter lacus]
MKLKWLLPVIILIIGGVLLCIKFFSRNLQSNESILSYSLNPKKEEINFYWKKSNGERIGSLGNFKKFIEGQNNTLLFAMNGGMFGQDFSPQGLYIENGKFLNSIDTLNGEGNFYLKPNGIFYINFDKKAFIVETEKFNHTENIQFATQSGPMLVINGKIHPEFRKGSKNFNIRNGVGITEDDKVIFAMSKNEINLYDFAEFFQKQGCKNALYLDGFVSRTYFPDEKWEQTDGDFGVIIGVIKPD